MTDRRQTSTHEVILDLFIVTLQNNIIIQNNIGQRKLTKNNRDAMKICIQCNQCIPWWNAT